MALSCKRIGSVLHTDDRDERWRHEPRELARAAVRGRRRLHGGAAYRAANHGWVRAVQPRPELTRAASCRGVDRPADTREYLLGSRRKKNNLLEKLPDKKATKENFAFAVQLRRPLAARAFLEDSRVRRLGRESVASNAQPGAQAQGELRLAAIPRRWNPDGGGRLPVRFAGGEAAGVAAMLGVLPRLRRGGGASLPVRCRWHRRAGCGRRRAAAAAPGPWRRNEDVLLGALPGEGRCLEGPGWLLI